jgi:imidazolonepropionase-like amidohydrolase
MAGAEQLLLRNVRIFDGTGVLSESGLDMLVEGERIMRTGRDLTAREGAATIDLGGKVLLPGLIDAHVHLAMVGDPDEVARIGATPAPVWAWNAAANARRTLEAGFTAVRDLGTIAGVSVALRDQVAAGRMPGPRIRAAASAICMTGGHGWWIGREADGPDDVRKAVREQLRAGADCIKLIATGGVMTPRVDPRSPQLTEDELRAGVEEAHKAFRKVGSHAQATAGIKHAVRAGVDSIEHGIYLDDEAIALMLERGTFLVPTLVAPEMISRHGIVAGVPDYMVEKSDRAREAHRESFRAAHRAGVRIAFGTDAGTPFNRHGANAEELALMVECGMSPAEAIVAATRSAADLLDLLEDAGTLEAGKRADLLVVDGDPLDDIRILGDPDRLVGVLQGGRWVRRAPSLGGD